MQTNASRDLLLSLATAGFAAASFIASEQARAAGSSGSLGTVWEITAIRIEPGSFGHFVDRLDGQWRKVQAFGRQERWVVSFHVLGVEGSRADEPDLLLAIEFNDLATTAQRREIQKRIEAMLAMDAEEFATLS